MSSAIALLLNLAVSVGSVVGTPASAIQTSSGSQATCREDLEDATASIDFPCTDDIITHQGYLNYVFAVACDAAKHEAEAGGHCVCENEDCDSPFPSHAFMEDVITPDGKKECRYSAVATATCYCCYDFDPQPSGDRQG